ncbi:tRNA-queuosine alpha-mannosyltransferase domain-containing protein [Marinomonas sp.]|uniref:tRNA-queuosine alpha-mannosyltransferase domain-containing protein n=1 Tax=Marinomonas sp. TaxID=1904862 RepID=UPI003BA944DA
MRILLISAYEASSHKAWANTLMNGLGQHDWEYLSLPARHFAWRIRGNAMSFAFDPKFKPILEKPYDLVIATSMTDCVGLKAFCPDLQNLPWLLYFHENQFAYPASDKQQGLIEMQMVTLYSALAANQCIFNSEFNKASFFAGARALLKKLPDYVSPDWLNDTEAKAQVLPVPLDMPASKEELIPKEEGRNIKKPEQIKLVWSARWEFDKGPDRLLAILEELERRQLDYEIAILGEQFRSTPKEFEQIQIQFAHRIRQFGFAPSRVDYLRFLASSDIVLSTALHEFQGLSVLEAVALGCVPVLPDRQVYPELFGQHQNGKQYLYQSDLNNIQQEAKNAADLIQFAVMNGVKAPNVSQYQVENLLAKYDELIEQYGR